MFFVISISGGSSSPYSSPNVYHQGGERRKAKDDKDDKKKPKVLVDQHLPVILGNTPHYDPLHQEHVEQLHHTAQLLPPIVHNPQIIHKDPKDYDKGKFKPNKPVQGTLVHTGEVAYDPHFTPVHEVYRPKNLNSHSEEQIWVPHYSSHNQGLQAFQDNQHGQVVAYTPEQHIVDSHYQGEGFYNHGQGLPLGDVGYGGHGYGGTL